MNDKQKKLLMLMPKLFLIMVITFYCSGFVQSELDLLWFVIGISFLVFLVFFYDIKKILD